MATAGTPPPHVVDLFLKLDQIDGESTDSQHKNQIVLESFGWGLTSPGTSTGGGGGAGKAVAHDFTVTKLVDKASPLLMSHAVMGKKIAAATMTARKAGKDQQIEFLVIKLNDVIVTSMQDTGNDQLPVEQVSFAFHTISVEFKSQTGSPTTFSWDLKANKAV